MHVKLFLPTKNKDEISFFAEKMTSLFGGCNVHRNITGYWLNDLEKLVIDEITMLESLAVGETERTILFSIKMLAKEVKTKFKQDSVAFGIGTMKLYFV